MPDDVAAAPAEQDQPTTLDSVLRNAGVPRSLSPELRHIAQRFDLRLDGEEEPGGGGEPPEPSEETEEPEGGGEPSFTEAYDPNAVPEEARPQLEAAYKQLQADYTRKRQEESAPVQEAQEYREFLTAIQNDPAARDAWLQQEFGYEFEDGEPEEFLDPEDELRARLEAVEGNLTQQQQEFVQEQQTAETMDQIAEGIESLEKTWGDGFEFKGKTLKAVQAYAEVHGPQAIPEIGEAMRELAEENRENWIESKKSPRRISQGTAASKAVIPKDRDERLALAVEAMEEADASA